MPQQSTQKNNKVFIGAKVSPEIASQFKSLAKSKKMSVSELLSFFLSKGDNHFTPKQG